MIIDYYNENIKKVYHELFDDALKKYNSKQTRNDRKIENYYKKIRSSKQQRKKEVNILDDKLAEKKEELEAYDNRIQNYDNGTDIDE